MDQIRLAGRETGWVVGDQVPHERLLFFLRGVLQVGGGAKSRGFGAIGLSFAGCHGCQSHCAHVVCPATGMRGIQLPTRLDYGASDALLRRVSLSHSVLNIAECYSRSRFRKFVANAIRSFASAEVNKASLGRATGSRRESHHEASRPKAL